MSTVTKSGKPRPMQGELWYWWSYCNPASLSGYMLCFQQMNRDQWLPFSRMETCPSTIQKQWEIVLCPSYYLPGPENNHSSFCVRRPLHWKLSYHLVWKVSFPYQKYILTASHQPQENTPSFIHGRKRQRKKTVVYTLRTLQNQSVLDLGVVRHKDCKK